MILDKKFRLGLCWIYLSIPTLLLGQGKVTPLEKHLHENSITRVTCQYNGNEQLPKVIGFAACFEGKAKNGIFHYKAYLPKGYYEDSTRRYPCMFIASNTGNAVMGSLERRLKSDEWITVMLEESQNGPWEPNVGNFLAAHDDAVARLRIQEGLKFAT